MHRNVTAISRTCAIGDLVRRELSDVGISSGDIHFIPDRDDPGGAVGRREDNKSGRLHDLHLPEDDVRPYQHSVRRGDCMVSAEAEDIQVGRVKSIMSRPAGE